MATRHYKDKNEETSENKHMKMSENSYSYEQKIIKAKDNQKLTKVSKEKFLCSETESESSSTNANNSKLSKGANDDKGTNTDGKNADKGEGINTDSKGKGANTNNKGGEKASIDNKGESIYDSYGSYNTDEEED
ncbi:hypothetical protein RCL_jg7578.t1 [Rhizophagus clarus]|uniref:Uncharacterized protein n=1 Tax=Rhizophagus clarus TaxID=94130 RepID=A0A8H3R352_9GLOM|nr:hypothetical protein RCL_jg7578.t1 [Rhizophagus clarus]